MYELYAPEPRMKVNVGIRRRLAPLLDNRRDKLEVANALLLCLPGSPFLYYGDEIGMGDNIWLDDRDASRTPMQWDETASAGFSEADPASFYLPVVSSEGFTPADVNVDAQRRDPDSLLNWTRSMLELRHRLGVMGTGSIRVLTADHPSILAFVREPSGPGTPVLCAFNFSDDAVTVTMGGVGPSGATLVDARAGDVVTVVDDDESVSLTLPPMSWHWLTVS